MAIVAVPVFTRLSPAEEHLYSHLLRSVGLPHSGNQILFAFAPLFRLQVRSYDDPAATPAFKHLSHLTRHGRHFGPLLRDYLEKVRQRLDETLREPSNENIPTKVCAHPFYAGKSPLGPEHASAQTVSIRHLIALHEQNVAVLGHLLHEVRTACNADDSSLLTMFATEPSLLELRPFQRHCRRDLVDLARRIINNPDSASPLKSDALVVLLADPSLSADIIGEIAAGVQGDQDLLEQFLVMLLANATKGPMVGSDVGVAIHKRVQNEEAAALIRASLQARDELCAPPSLLQTDDATQAVVKAISILISHAQGARDFAWPGTWIQTDPAAVRAQQLSTPIRQRLERALVVAREYLAPALEGLEYLARNEQQGRASGALDAARTDLIHLLYELSEFTDSLGPLPLGIAAVRRIEDLWTGIRANTQFGGSYEMLARPPRPARAGTSTDNTGALEVWLPQFFCLPVGVVIELGTTLKWVSVTADWQQQSLGIEAVLVRAPLLDVRDTFELLLGDARQHGTGAHRVDFARVLKHDSPQLHAVVSNVVGTTPRPGLGISKERVREIARRHLWEVHFPEKVSPGDTYQVRLVFPVVYDVPKE
jgi:hypothetical protein